MFESGSGQIVLADLAKYCHARNTIWVEGDPYSSAILEGRRQVFLYISGYIRLTEERIEQMTNRLAILEGDEHE